MKPINPFKITSRNRSAVMILFMATAIPRIVSAADPSVDAFIDAIQLDEKEIRVNGLWNRTVMRDLVAMDKKGQRDQVLERYEAYFFEQLRNPGPNGMLVDPPTGLPGQRDAVVKVADQLMEGVIQYKGGDVRLGEPGKVNWNFPYEPGEPVPPDETPLAGLFTGLQFNPLMHAYLHTGDRKYLDRWVAYMDDWARNSTYPGSVHPCFLPSGVNPKTVQSLNTFIDQLAILANGTSEPGPALVPPETFARVMWKYIHDFVLPGVVYLRSNTHNWTPFPALMKAGMNLDELTVGELFFREGRRRNIEDNAVTQNLRDGTENQQCPWYNDNYIKGMVQLFDLLKKRDAITRWWELGWVRDFSSDHVLLNEIREHLADHVSYLIHLRTTQNEWPIPFRGGDKRRATIPSYFDSPEAYQRPDVMAVLSAVLGGNLNAPSFDSEWFPYGGYNIVRDGWSPNNIAGYMFASPYPGAYGAYRSRANNNTFGLRAYGQDLLVDDTTGHYMYPGSPVLVDGREQFFHAKYGIYKVPEPGSHKTYMVSAWTDPASWRWHASDYFNLMEGVYDGPYGDKPLSTGVVGSYGAEEAGQETLALKDVNVDVKHQRLALYDRGADLWILTDRMWSAGEHAYEQVWMIPTLPGGDVAFDAGDITIDEKAKVIRTDAGTAASRKKKAMPKANMTMRQFSHEPLTYTRKNVPKQPIKDGRVLVYGWERIGAQWKGTGSQEVITAIYPRKLDAAPEDDLNRTGEIRGEHNALGFEADLPGGQQIKFLSSPVGRDEMKIGTVHVVAGSLLVNGKRGVVLDCEDMSIDGRRIDLSQPDFEFELVDGGSPRMTPIYRPIAPVEIGPEETVFIDIIDVTLSTPTPGVEIRYTLDGTDPTPHSALYTAPVRIDHTAVIKARAYRPETRTNPPQMSGTHATVASRAVFTRTRYTEPVNAKNTSPGLNCRYWEDDWKTIWLSHDRLESAATGSVSTLWDFSLIPASNPPTGEGVIPRKNFYGVEYSGYMKVPEDGVYTFHAPREFVMPDIDAGYEMQLFVGQRIVPWGGRTGSIGLNAWYPSTRLHSFGNWSIALRAGLHPVRVVFIDYRTAAAQHFNKPGLRDYIWSGDRPDLKVSGPGLAAQPIPAAWWVR